MNLKELNTETHQCLKIDKRKQLTYKEWKIDNCSLSEHKWTGLNQYIYIFILHF